MKYRKYFYFFSVVVIALIFLRNSFTRIDVSTWSLLLMTNNEATFLKTWSRIQKSQVDNSELLGPCEHCVANSLKPSSCFRQHDKTDITRSYLSAEIIREAGDFSHLFVKTRNFHGHEKLIGGDGWKVSLNGPSFLSASVFDLTNGTYEIVFLPVLPGRYKVQIVLVYSMCKGILSEQGSQSRLGKLEYNVEIPEPKGDLLLNKLQFHMKYREYFNFLWSGYGTWQNERGNLKWRPYIKIDDRPRKVSYRQRAVRGNGTLWLYGDKYLQIYNSVVHRPLCTKIFAGCQNATAFYPKEDLSSLSLNRVTQVVLNSFTSLLNYSLNEPKDAVIFNPGFIGHLPYGHYVTLIKAIGRLLKNITTNGSKHAQFIWSTMTLLPRDYYTSHFYIYNAYANHQMCDAGIPILDLFPLTDSHPNYRHFSRTRKPLPHLMFESVERLLEDYFERTADR